MVTVLETPSVLSNTLSDSTKSVALSTGVSLPYVEQGDPTGIPVIFLHGITDSWQSFAPVLPLLPPHIHAFALTQRGHGDADRPASGYHPRDFAADVAAFLDARGLETAVIAGHSMGSTVALRFALDYPERTRALVLMGAFARYATNPVITQYLDECVFQLVDPIDRSIAREFQESTLAAPIAADLLTTYIDESLKVPARVWRDAFAGLLTDEHADRLEDVQAPALLVWGDQDAFVPKMDQYQLLAAIPDSRLKVYEGVGHALHWEEPQRFATDVVDFLAGLSNESKEPIGDAAPETRDLVAHH